jgi:ribosome-binding ATPase YchF (GTP1/OBG family)
LAAVTQAGLNPHTPVDWSDVDLKKFATELRKVSKPMIVAANKADKEFAEENINRIKEAGYHVVATSAEAELALRRAADNGLIFYTPGAEGFEIVKPDNLSTSQLKALKIIREKVFERWGSSGVQKVIDQAFFKLLDVIVVYPVEDADKLTDHQGRVLPDCYLVPKGTNARKFAGIIHSDLEESFIYALDARSKKRLGESYTLQNNDIIQIVAAKAHK